MSMISKIIKTGVAGCALALVMSTSAIAGGSLAPVEEKAKCSLSANVALTSDYIFRGLTQTFEDPAIQGGMDLGCGIFYAGVWGSNVDFDDETTVEIDVYAGITPSYKGINFDLGVIGYLYDDADDLFEAKVGVSTDIAGITAGFTGYFEIEDGDYQVYEISAEKAFSGKIGPFSPTLSALVGFFETDDDGDYTYWNAGVGLGFAEKFNLDLRYWDTDIDEGIDSDARFVATVSASF